jgi:hypothetical protein
MKFFMIVMTTICFILLLSWIVMLPVSFKNEECKEKNGVLVRTVDGLQCFNQKFLVKT